MSRIIEDRLKRKWEAHREVMIGEVCQEFVKASIKKKLGRKERSREITDRKY